MDDKEVFTSVVTPCFNGEKFIDNYMKGIFSQTTKAFEVIITDDGSTDNSLEKLKSYEDKFNSNGISYRVIHKESGGQPSAFNIGVSYASGKYIVWPDIDDLMHPDFIEKKALYMEEHYSVDFLLSKSAIVNISEPDKIIGYTWPVPFKNNEDLMNRILWDKNIWYEPGAFMCKASSLDKFIKNRKIYQDCGKWSGPQFQIMLPFFFYGNVGYLNDCLYDYYIHEKQDHNKFNKKEDIIRKCDEVEKTIVSTVKSLDANEKEMNGMLEIIKIRMNLTRLYSAFKFRDRIWFNSLYNAIPKKYISRNDKIRHILINYLNNNFSYRVYNEISKHRNKV